MKLLSPTRTRFFPFSEQDKALVRTALGDVLQSVHFAHSKRYPALLTYVVEKALDGDVGNLKERTVGVEVFNRQPDYDNNDDTIVRVTAGEVRKRLALVYHEGALDHPIQIELAAGSYLPEFFLATESDESPTTTLSMKLPVVDAPSAAVERKIASRSRAILWAVLSLGVATLLGYGTLRWLTQPDSVHRFWAPVRLAKAPVILCPGAMVLSATGTTIVKAQKTDPYPYISMATANSLSSLVATMAKQNIDYTIHPTSSITLTDMREHPTILMGAYNNDWSLRLLSNLRYRFTDESTKIIYDSTNPSVAWVRPPHIAYEQAEDYAIVARFSDRLTENFVVVVAGIGKNGTEAAAQFVTNPRYLDLLDQPQWKGWESKNLEVVLRTNVIDGRAGPPDIEAVYLW